MLIGHLGVGFGEDLDAEQVFYERSGTSTERLDLSQQIRFEFQIEDLLGPRQIVRRVTLCSVVQAAAFPSGVTTTIAGTRTSTIVPATSTRGLTTARLGVPATSTRGLTTARL
jgi:hypothetical protein